VKPIEKEKGKKIKNKNLYKRENSGGGQKMRCEK
jgi:hypothetical protein